MAFPPAVSDFKIYFPREFRYGDGTNTVMTADVERALNEAGIMFNQGLWDTTTPVGSLTEGGIAYLYLAAHILVQNVQGAGGLSAINFGKGVDSQTEGVITSKGAGGVSIGQEFPPMVKDSPILNQFLMTAFGRKYLEMLTPRLVGNVALVSGRSPWNAVIEPTIP
jgi:hypothetical protein